MTLPKKGTRTIKVEGRTYRWMVRHVRGPVGVIPHLHLTVEDPQTRKLIQRDFPAAIGTRLDDCGDREDIPNSISSATVREFILERFPS